jgi:hypothetical protein
VVRGAADYLNRGNNLFAAGFLGVLAVGEVTSITVEGGLRGAFDEGMITVTGAVAVGWYLMRTFKRSLVPAFLLVAALVFKIVALVIEDPDDRGDDIGIAIILVATVVAWLVIHFRSAREATA